MSKIILRVGRYASLGAALLTCCICLSLACSQQSTSETSVPAQGLRHPEWSYNLSIYEVNLRQYSEAGTFREFEKHLPRLKEMGVGILWFMPIHPIGEKNRKGSLGSYYSVRDYLAVNPEHGTMADFKALVKQIHAMEMYVILDWVANHTAWDNPLTVEHPDWYTKDRDGNFVPPVADWHDVIDLNYDSPDLRKYMIDALKFWVQEANVDGFRCDVAEMVPLDFWIAAREELDRVKPVFMLAEGEAPELHKAFDMTYSWTLFRLMNDIADGKRGVEDLSGYLNNERRSYSDDAFRMLFTTNHDENTWNGTVFERLGPGVKPFAVLAMTLPGMPLVYSGQEAGLDKRLAFFEKDPIVWRDHEMSDVYSTLLNLKRENPALWHGVPGRNYMNVPNSSPRAVYSFVRQSEGNKVLVVLNLSGEPHRVSFEGDDFIGEFTDVFSDNKTSFVVGGDLQLGPWEYRVFAK